MNENNIIHIQIDYHQSGRWTLKEKYDGQNMWLDVNKPGLLGNSKSASFYQKVATRLSEHAMNNIVVASYKDTGADLS